MEPGDDYYRYIEYLQNQTLEENWRDCFNASHWKSWTERNRERLQKMADQSLGCGDPSLINKFELFVNNFSPKTQFEIPITKPIFEPIFDEVRKAAEGLGITPIRSVEVVTSTLSSATPAARPTSAEHLLFIGLGTSSFCNYWAKCVTAFVRAMADESKRILSVGDAKEVLRPNADAIAIAAQLSLYYATFGTTVGFGEVRQPASYAPYRLQLLHAMETFAVAHEYAHFVAEERFPNYSGSLEASESRRLEFFCDELGLVLSRECGQLSGNGLTFAGIGALVFFRAIQLCEAVRALLIAQGQISIVREHSLDESSHPPVEERIAELITQTYLKTASDQREGVKAFVDEYDRILQAVAAMVLESIELAFREREADRGDVPTSES